MIFTVEEKHEGYHDWYETVAAFQTYIEAEEYVLQYEAYKKKITEWKDGKRFQEWLVIGTHFQILCVSCYQEKNKEGSCEVHDVFTKEKRYMCEDCIERSRYA